jgi:branched-chain amino acid aminotransferase
MTPDEGALLGITRRTVLELAAELGIPAKADTLLAERLRQADEVFLASTAGGVCRASHSMAGPLRTCRPGSQTLQIKQAYWAAHERADWTSEVAYE